MGARAVLVATAGARLNPARRPSASAPPSAAARAARQVNGGKWIVRLKKGLAARYWEDVLLAVLGGQFRVGDEICGCVLSVRYQEDILPVWNRSADSRKVCMQIRDTMRNVMGLPIDATMEYKKHTDSMRDNSSYRNTNSNF